MIPGVEVRTYCRLHFGLTSLGHDSARPQFGGVGAMVDAQGICLQLTPSHAFGVAGPLSPRVNSFAETIAEQWQLPALPDVNIKVVSAPREHVGLGVGTQLALAVAAGLGEALGLRWRDPLRLAQLTGRGRRSAVGSYGFLQGGMIIDGGHLRDDSLGQLRRRVEVPEDWRFVLFVPKTETGCAGVSEERAFTELPAVPLAVTAEMEQIAMEQLIPTLMAAEFTRFSEALFRYGTLAGECFAAVQGGAFCSPLTAELISWLRGRGIAGVGQSSWGPTVFALSENQSTAEQLVREFAGYPTSMDYEVLVAPPANHGARIKPTSI